MKKTIALPLALALFITAAWPVLAAAEALDCSGGIVSVGDSRIDLLLKCGEPDAKETHQEVFSDSTLQGEKRKLYVTIDEWTYNFGPARFMRVVTLRDGKVADIRVGGYGYDKSVTPGQGECGERIISVGDAKTDVLAKCGEPAWTESRQESLSEKFDDGQARKVFVTVEEWTYNFGPNRFLRIFTFRNGKLSDIRTGGYGYEMKQDEKGN
jgi:hypothetical protein